MVPPMLNIPFLELMGRAEEEVLAREAWLRVDERHYVLQLVAETEGTPRLVVSTAGPKTARKCLVQEPAVGQNIDGRLWRFDIYRAECMVPILPDLFERPARGSTSAEDAH